MRIEIDGMDIETETERKTGEIELLTDDDIKTILFWGMERSESISIDEFEKEGGAPVYRKLLQLNAFDLEEKQDKFTLIRNLTGTSRIMEMLIKQSPGVFSDIALIQLKSVLNLALMGIEKNADNA